MSKPIKVKIQQDEISNFNSKVEFNKIQRKDQKKMDEKYKREYDLYIVRIMDAIAYGIGNNRGLSYPKPYIGINCWLPSDVKKSVTNKLKILGLNYKISMWSEDYYDNSIYVDRKEAGYGPNNIKMIYIRDTEGEFLCNIL